MTTYWCDIGTSGTRTSTIRPISAANIPPQSTTISHSMLPRSVRTRGDPSALGVDADDTGVRVDLHALLRAPAFARA